MWLKPVFIQYILFYHFSQFAMSSPQPGTASDATAIVPARAPATPVGKLFNNPFMKKARTKYSDSPLSPLLPKDGYQKMEDGQDEEELIPGPVEQLNFDGVVEDSSGERGQVTMAGIAGLRRKEMARMTKAIQDLRKGFGDLDLRMSSLADSADVRLSNVEKRIDITEVQIEKLENLVKQLSEKGSSFHTTPKKDSGGQCLASRQTFFAPGPAPAEIYSKGDFGGALFAEFQNSGQRDAAVDFLRKAGLKSGGRNIWANQGRPIMERAARNFCFGLKHVFKKAWDIPCAVSVSDEAPYSVWVGGELAVTARIFPDKVVREWHGDWASWEELHSSPEVRDLTNKCDSLAVKATTGMKGSKGRGK
ncbi:unnamed protein product, partial [Prorocentrum cordatum]